MRFSTRNTHKHGKTIVLAASAAVLGIGGIVSQIYQKNAAAETSSVDSRIFYANTEDYTSPDDAATDAATTLGVGQAAFCNIGSGTDGAVTRVNPYTKENAEYWVFAKDSSSCPTSAATPEGEILLNNNGATILDKTYDDTYMAENYAKPLGPLGAFHVIGFDHLELGNQTNGNILTPSLGCTNSCSYIGYFEKPTISYAQVIGEDVGSSFSFANSHENDTNVLVTGSTTAVGNADDGKKWTLNGSKSNMPDRIVNGKYANNLWQESDTSEPFLDIAALKVEAKAWSAQLSEQTQTLTEDDYDFNNENQLSITVPESARNSLNVLNLNKSLLQGSHDVCIYGFDQHIPGTLLLNVDLAGETDFQMNNSFKLCYKSADLVKYPDSIQGGATSVDQINFDDGSRKCVREQWIHDKFENHVIINFYDSSKADKNYTENITIARETTTFAVAPEANVNITASSFQGILIADTVNSGADTYYLSLNDLQPLLPKSCAYTIKHVNKTTGEVFETYTVDYSGVCEDYNTDEPTIITPENAILNNGFQFVGAKYEDNGEGSPMVFNADDADESTRVLIENGEEIDKGIIPLGIWNDLESKTITLYYQKPCTIVVEHREEGTQTELAPREEYAGFCGELSETIDLANDILDEYDFTSGIEVNSDTSYNRASDFPFETGPVESDHYYILEYAKKDTPTPDVCSIEIHHYIVNTTTPVDDDITMTQTCNNVEMVLDISEKALNNGYKFVSGKLESERALDNYTEEDFPMNITNNFPMKVYTLYYEKVPGDDTDVPNTSAKNNAYLFAATGATIAFGATLIINRRRQG